MGIISYVNEEIQVIRERDPAIKSNMEVFLYSSFKAILHYRIAHKLYLKKHYFLARWVSQRAVRKTGIHRSLNVREFSTIYSVSPSWL